MQSINHDMDDLFRKAAEDYPLHTKTGDWDKLMQKMEHEERDGQRNNRSRSKWLLLLLPLLFVCNRFVYVNHDASLPMENKTEPGRKSRTDQSLSPGHLNGAVPHTTTGSDLRPAEKETIVNSNENNVSLEGSRFILKGSGEKNINLSLNRTASVSKESRNRPGGRDEAVSATTGRQKPGVSKREFTGPAGAATGKEAEPVIEAETAIKDGSTIKGETTTKEDQKLSEKPTSLPSDTLAKANEMRKKNKTVFARGGYLGVMGGPDRSSVRSSKARGVGYSAGLLAGYQFSKRLSVETGVYWDRKKYATDGKGFSTTQFNWLPHTNLLSIAGYCDMIEIPLVVRFNVIPAGRRSVFATAGASSYIMKKEDYQYDTERYGVYYSGKKTYTSSSAHLMPVLHLSAGYEQTIGRNVKLRLEPYMKIPVAGIGVGNMSLKSTGILVGITRSIR